MGGLILLSLQLFVNYQSLLYMNKCTSILYLIKNIQIQYISVYCIIQDLECVGVHFKSVTIISQYNLYKGQHSMCLADTLNVQKKCKWNFKAKQWVVQQQQPPLHLLQQITTGGWRFRPGRRAGSYHYLTQIQLLCQKIAMTSDVCIYRW